MKLKIKKFVSLLLVTAMCSSLLPAMPAVAASGDPVPKDEYKQYTDHAQMRADGFSGIVARYVAPNTGDNQTEYSRVDFGVYNVGPADGFDYRFRYDPKTVTLMRNNKGVFSELPFSASIADINKLRAVTPRHYTDESIIDPTQKEKLKNSYVFSNSETGTSNQVDTYDEGMFITPAGAVIEIGVSDTEFIGRLGVALNKELSPHLNTYIKGHSGRPIDTTGYSEPIYFYSGYFALQEGKTITADTFGYYKGVGKVTSQKGGSATLTSQDNVSDETATVGFPKPEAPKFAMAVTVQQKVDVAAPLVGAQVVITAPDGTTKYPASGFYTTSAEGKLMDGANVLQTIDLPEGTGYTYTVTPVGSTELQAHTDTFDVSAAGAIVMYAETKLAETKDFTITVFDDQSADKKSPLEGAQISIDGELKGSVTGATGQTTFQTTVGTHKIDIKKDGYIVSTLEGTDFRADGKAYAAASGAEIAPVMQARRTAVTVEAKAGELAIPGAVITVSKDSAANAKVTPNMAKNELPMSKTAVNGAATFNLPAGNYIYKVAAPGYEEVAAIAVTVGAATADGDVVLTVGGTAISDAGVVEGGTKINTTKLEQVAGSVGNIATISKTTVADLPVNPVISDPLYYAVGEWNSESNPTAMTVKVYLKNASSTNGAFGLKYDTNIFAAPTFEIGADLAALKPVQLELGGGNTVAIENPTMDNGYHAFSWESKDGGKLDAMVDPVLIGTYSVPVLAGKDAMAYVNSNSLSVKPYSETKAAAAILAAYGADKEGAADFIGKYWRPTDAQNTAGNLGVGRLDKAKASLGGFQQVMHSADGVTVQASDARSQFTFPAAGRVGIVFSVKEGTVANPGNAIGGATIVVRKGAVQVATGTTDQYGAAIIGVPQNDEYSYTVEAVGFKSQEVAAITVTTVAGEQNVYMETDKAHPVKIAQPSAAKVQLLGAPFAPNGKTYIFNLQPKAGFAWATGHPVIADVTAKYTDISGVEQAEPTLAVAWDSAKNSYSIEIGTTVDADYPIEISLDDASLVAAKGITVTATAGEGGTLSYDANGNGSTFEPTTPNSKTTVETLATSSTISAKYKFEPSNTITDPSKLQKVNVVSKVLVNGVAIELSEAQRLYGLDYQLTNITKNQTISVLFAETTLIPENPFPLPDSETEVPISEGVVALTVGQYGKATVDANVLVGFDTKNYTIAADGTFVAVIEAETNVAQPGGNSVNYEIDQILINGTEISNVVADETLGNATWTANTKSLSISPVAKGTYNAVIVTFKPVGGASIQAIVKATQISGNGTATPMGASIYTIGDMPIYEFAPAPSWKTSKVELEKPKQPAIDVTDSVKNQIYQFPALEAGTTEMRYSFAESTNIVQLRVDYMNGATSTIIPKTSAKITFERILEAGDTRDPLTLVFDKLQAPTAVAMDYQCAVPQGKWRVTVEKKGWLKYVVEGFEIKADGTTPDTFVDGDKIIFGKKASGVETISALKPQIGDASWDGLIIAMDDAAQVANGLYSKASAAAKARADIDEDSAVQALNDMAYVKNAYGRRFIKLDYSNFLPIV